jgi:hypothetical protein
MGVIDDVVAGAADVVKATGHLLAGVTTLIYQAGFENRALDPVVDVMHLGPLHPTQTASLGSDPLGPKLEMVPAQPAQGRPAGLRLKLARPLGADGTPLTTEAVAVGAVVHPFPPGLDLFMLTGRFELAEGPHGMPDAWAVTIQARQGDIPDTITDRRQRITVTLQSSYNAAATDPYGARMNTPGGGPPGTPYPIPSGLGSGPWVPEAVRDGLYSMEPFRSGFKLEQLVDRRADIGRAGLHARIHSNPYIERRWFVHDLIGISKGPITTAGFMLAIAGGNGPVEVTVTDFRIYRVRRGIFDVLTALPFVGGAVAGVLNDMRV